MQKNTALEKGIDWVVESFHSQRSIHLWNNEVSTDDVHSSNFNTIKNKVDISQGRGLHLMTYAWTLDKKKVSLSAAI